MKMQESTSFCPISFCNSLKIFQNNLFFLLLTLIGNIQEQSVNQIPSLTLQYSYNLVVKFNPVIHLPTKFCLVKALVFPVVMYGCESWTQLSH